MIRKTLLLLAAVTAILLLALAAACGGDDDDNGTATATPEGTGDETGSPIDSGDLPTAEALQAFFEAAVEMKNGGDAAGFVTLFSDKGLAEFTGDTVTPTAELREQTVESLATGGPTITVTSVENIEPYERNIGLDVNSAQGRVLVREYFELLPYEGSYLIDAYLLGSPDVPKGVTSVNTSATEFAYEFLSGDPNGDGNIAFVLTNNGQQPHEIVLMKVAEEPTLDDLVDIAVNSDPNDLPAEIEEFVGRTFADPAATSTLAFAEPLAAGRYALMCFIPDDADDVPHASKGMAAEFTVE